MPLVVGQGGRHEWNPLIKEDIFGQECGVPSYQDGNINVFFHFSIFTFNQRRHVWPRMSRPSYHDENILKKASSRVICCPKSFLLNSMNGLAGRDGDIFQTLTDHLLLETPIRE